MTNPKSRDATATGQWQYDDYCGLHDGSGGDDPTTAKHYWNLEGADKYARYGIQDYLNTLEAAVPSVSVREAMREVLRLASDEQAHMSPYSTQFKAASAACQSVRAWLKGQEGSSNG